MADLHLWAAEVCSEYWTKAQKLMDFRRRLRYEDAEGSRRLVVV
jgi:hypothetical protein